MYGVNNTETRAKKATQTNEMAGHESLLPHRYTREQLLHMRGTSAVRKAEKELRLPDFVRKLAEKSSTGCTNPVQNKEEIRKTAKHSVVTETNAPGSERILAGRSNAKPKRELNVSQDKGKSLADHRRVSQTKTKGLGKQQAEKETGKNERKGNAELCRENREENRNAFVGRTRVFKVDDLKNVTDATEITLKLVSCIEEFEEFLDSDNMSIKDTVSVLQILIRVTTCELQRESILMILRVVCTSRYIDLHLINMLMELKNQLKELEKSVVTVIKYICIMFSNICLKLPSFAAKCSLLLGFLCSQPELSALLEKTASLKRRINKFQDEFVRCFTLSRDSNQQNESTRKKRDHFEDDEVPPEDFRELPIFPDGRDLEWKEKPFLRANKPGGAFKDLNHYLDVQFRLLREDYIRPLRNGIAEYKSKKQNGKSLRKSQDIRLYHGVYIRDIEFGQTGLEHRIQFDTTHFQSVKWEYSKRLINGSLVCLSKDDFQTIFFATVTKRVVDDLEQGFFQVKFENRVEETLLPSSDVFVMAETTTFFEAYRHVLEGLQEISGTFPMDRYVVDCQKQINPPAYLLEKGALASMNLQSVLRDGSTFKASEVAVLNSAAWPSLTETIFNTWQMEAVKTALTKELAIIQGPPGTGKTFVGLKVAKVLLDNQSIWTRADDPRPILIVCYTNHALDQFLEGILQFCPEGIVRVGSRSKSESLERFNLNEMRSKIRTGEAKPVVGRELRQNLRECSKVVEEHTNNITKIVRSMEALTELVVHERLIEHYMLPGQFKSLTSHAHTTSSPSARGVLLEWLSIGTISEIQNTGQGEGNNTYAALVSDMKQLILMGSNSCNEEVIDRSSVLSLPHSARAQLYRFWLSKTTQRLQERVDADSIAGRDAGGVRELLEMAQHEILPDHVLKDVVSEDMFQAITSHMMQEHQSSVYCIRTWLGIQDSGTEEEIMLVQNQLYEDLEDIDDEYEFLQFLKFLQQHQSNVSVDTSTDSALLKSATPTRFQELEPSQEVNEDNVRPTDNEVPIVKSDNDAVVFPSDLNQLDVQTGHAQSKVHGKGENLEVKEDSREENTQTESKKENQIDKEDDIVQAERLLDDEDDDEKGFIKVLHSNQFSAEELNEFSFVGANGSLSEEVEDGFEFVRPMGHRKDLAKKLNQLLASCKPMTKQEAAKVDDLWDIRLTVKDRARLYLFWIQGYKTWLSRNLKRELDDFTRESARKRELKLEEDKEILCRAKVIGMTTTGAARYRQVLAAVGCPIVMLEEAAEVLEAHVVTTLNKNCRQLILIGDHQQLRPSPTVYELCVRYNLDVSLFERLVNNHLPHTTLAVQHRMRPEIARLVRHVYPDLEDHVTTTDRPNIRGVKENVFFLHHEEKEEDDDNIKSKSNKHEAKLCLALCRYLLQQDYEASRITILTGYTGQVLVFKQLINKSKLYKDVRVTPIDNYQGEENDIIILSLVRSNEEGIVGFLKTDNRVCVALSRARNGLYVFGNFRILEKSSDLWKQILKTANEHGQMGTSLVIRCENHPDVEVMVTCAEDFDKAKEGGCNHPCGTRLICGHACPLLCHVHDRDHVNYRCQKPCEVILCERGHFCPKKCSEKCGKCVYTIQKSVPGCGHVVMMECSKDPEEWECQEPCQEIFPCGHQCGGKCKECQEKGHTCHKKVERTLSCGHTSMSLCHQTESDISCSVPCNVSLDCGHVITIPCSKNKAEITSCSSPCSAKLPCGHVCQGTCKSCKGGLEHVACSERCKKSLKACGHQCKGICGSDCLPCKHKCQSFCRHGTCKVACGLPCVPCKLPCSWKCHHQPCSASCYKPCVPCRKPCPRRLKCGHKCYGLCLEACVCFRCEGDKFVPLPTQQSLSAVSRDSRLIKLPQCKHVFLVDALDAFVLDRLKVLRPKASLRCPACSTPVRNWDCWRYHWRLQARQHVLSREPTQENKV